MSPRTRAYLQIHTAVLLYGITGILGDLIVLPKPTLVWWRMLLTALSFLLWPGLLRQVRSMSRRDLAAMVGIGSLVALHWVTFFGAIQLTNVSVTLAVMATASFFTAILEPILLGGRFRWYELLLGVVVVPAVALVKNSTDFAWAGILVALSSAALAATFSILNKKLVDRHNPVALTFVELGSGGLLLTLGLPFWYAFVETGPFFPTGNDWIYLPILAFVCTSFAYVINLQALRVLPAFAVNLTINLEPVYSIILAYFILRESDELYWGFYLGAALIILAVFLYPVLARQFGVPDKQSS
ncbi:MAG: DMT family transporter [Bacteroidota bacterium]